MSVHPSLKIRTTEGKRCVLSRIERLKLLLSVGMWKEGDPVFGLPKTDPVKLKMRK